MTIIQSFKRVRRDGKVIDESMTAEDMFTLGLPEKIIELQWYDGSRPISFRADYGVLARVISGRESVAAIEENDELGEHSTLWIINADGSRRLQVSNTQPIHGKDITGEFGWLTKPRIEASNIFGAIFGRRDSSSMFHLDIDATNGNVIGVYEAR